MADPLSITLTVVTLATALKDLIELAQKINESFKKPARNVRAAKALAEETLEIITGLQNFYDGHKEKLDTALEMREAVLKLLTDMKAVYGKCRPMLQIYDSSKRRLYTIIKQKIHAWRHRDDLEEQIRNLRDLANKCHRQFMTFAIVRIEANTTQTQATAVEIQTTTVQIRSAVADGFTRAYGHAPPLRVSDNNTLAFLGSAPVILSILPPHVQLSERLIYRSYITVQVGKIETLFKALASCGSYPVKEPDSLHLKPLRTSAYIKLATDEGIEDLQSEVFSLIVKIQESLKTGPQLAIELGAYAMSNLSVMLYNLGMVQEFSTIIQFAVDLYRSLSKTNEDVYGPHLAHALSSMSVHYTDTGDDIEAYKVSTEAVTLGRRLADANPTFETQMQLAHLVSGSAYIGRLNVDGKNAIKDAEESVQSYQRLIGHHESMLQADAVIEKSSWMSFQATCVYNFADALQALHYSLSGTPRCNESVKAGAQALDIYRSLKQRHNRDNGAFSDKIARLSSSLASDEYRAIVPVDQALLYARESVHHYEKILQNTGVVPKELPFSLGLEVKLLSRLKRYDDAHRICQKLARMIQIHMDDQELRAQSFMQLIGNLFKSKCFAEAALRVENLYSMNRSFLSDQHIFQVYRYTLSAFDEIGDHWKSIQVAEVSVSYWRTLAFQNTKYLQYVARCLLSLTWRYLWVKDYERALNEGEETMKLYGMLIKEDASLLQDYIDVLRLNIDIAKKAKEMESLERSRLVLQFSRALTDQFPDKQLIPIQLIRDHAAILEKFDRLADASVAISESLDWFDVHPAQDLYSADLHIDCLIDFARFLCLQGHPERVPSLCGKAIAIGQPFLRVNCVSQGVLWAKAYNLLASYLMGHISIACSEIDDCLIFASKHRLEEAGPYAFFLQVILRLYRSNGRVDDALVITKRSITLDRHNMGPTLSIVSELLADTGQEADAALIVAQEAIRRTEKWMGSPNNPVNEHHVQAQYSLALRLFAGGEFTQARELLAEVRLFYQRHSKQRNIWFIDLAITLWTISHLECTSGRHEEGIAARAELNELRKHLRLVFPSLDDLVEVGLNREKNFAAWKRLLEKYSLSCGHQDEGKISEANAHRVTSLSIASSSVA